MTFVPLEAYKVVYNWSYTFEGGDEYEKAELGSSNFVGGEFTKCTKITVFGEDYYSNTHGELIQPYAVIEYANGHVVHVTNLNQIFYKPTEVKNDK